MATNLFSNSSSTLLVLLPNLSPSKMIQNNFREKIYHNRHFKNYTFLAFLEGFFCWPGKFLVKKSLPLMRQALHPLYPLIPQSCYPTSHCRNTIYLLLHNLDLHLDPFIGIVSPVAGLAHNLVSHIHP